MQNPSLRDARELDHDVPTAEHNLDKVAFVLVNPVDLVAYGIDKASGDLLPCTALHCKFVQAIEQKEKPCFTPLGVERIVR